MGKYTDISYMKTFINKVVLRNFFKIDLSGTERAIAIESVQDKYAPSLLKAFVVGMLMVPTILFLDTEVLISVLIPITMVAGTAWFAISLANVKEKFAQFGVELTTAMFISFASSLIVLSLLTIFSLGGMWFEPLRNWGVGNALVQTSSAVSGIMAVFYILWSLFTGALKYDMNDAMLTGQNEAAERFYRKSLSLLYAAASNLREGKGLEVANYYLGVSFFEVFTFIRSTGILNGKLQALMDKAMELKHHPDMDQTKADEISTNLIDSFVMYCINVDTEKAQKGIENIKDELNSLKTKEEPQAVVDTRLSIIFEEIAGLLESQGESLFKKREK